jgi:hypothetical protein
MRTFLRQLVEGLRPRGGTGGSHDDSQQINLEAARLSFLFGFAETAEAASMRVIAKVARRGGKSPLQVFLKFLT